MTRVLIFGGSGMMGHTVFRVLSARPDLNVFVTLRGFGLARSFPDDLRARLISGVDMLDLDAVAGCLEHVRPNVVINCTGLVKQSNAASDPLVAIPINALVPHRLSRLSALVGARFIHMGTDCVFRGDRGGYTEDDRPDADDLYGRSKLLGEVDGSHAVTLRTSIIGRELRSKHGLLEWFLNSSGTVRGYVNAIFSGLTTDELARVIADHVIPNPALNGILNVSVAPISKYDLLLLLREAYGHRVEIIPETAFSIDRSLDSTRFRSLTGYQPPEWPAMVSRMREQGEWA